MRSQVIAVLGVVAVVVGCEGPKLNECKADSDCRFNEHCNQELLGCFPNACAAASECPAGSVCVDQLCVPPPDGGLCPAGCPSGLQCVVADCVARYASVLVTAPVDGSATRAATLAVTAQLELSAGRERADPAELAGELKPVGGASSFFVLTSSGGGAYGGNAGAVAEGAYEVTVRYPDAGLSSAVTHVRVDRTAPSFTVQVPAPVRPDGGTRVTYVDADKPTAWRRDEKVTLTVASAADDVAMVTVYLSGTDGGEAGPFGATPSTGCGPGYCGKVEVDLAKPPMGDFRADFGVRVAGEDTAGNAGSGTGSIGVTRWKWSYLPLTGGIKATPAIGADGTVYFGTFVGAPSGLYAVTPEGQTKWVVDAGGIEASPAVGGSGADELVFYADNSDPARLAAVRSSDGTLVKSCDGASGTKVLASLAVASFSAGAQSVPGAVGVLNDTGNSTRLVAIVPGGGSECIRSTDSLNGAAEFPATVVAKGTDYFWGDKGGALRRYTFTGSMGPWVPAGSPWPVNVGMLIRGLAIPASGTDVVGGGGVLGAVFRVPFAGAASIPWQYPASNGQSAWSPIIAAGDTVYFGDETPRLTRIVLNTTSGASQPTLGNIRAAPLQGEAGHLYTVDDKGYVTAWSSSLQQEWTVHLMKQADASPAIDCGRDANGAKASGRPGVLYLGDSNTRMLHAIVVDSRGIDTTAPWPKYQHDPRNTGNADTAMSEFVCP